MRRPATEWLLAPVFALPLVAAASLVLWARHDYLRRIEPYRGDGEAAARRWIARDEARLAWLAGEIASALPQAAVPGYVPVAHPLATVLVRVPGAPTSSTWTVTSDYPGGVTPAGLADADARVAVETGTAAAREVPVDPGTAAFRDVLARRDLDALRTAPLPAATKLYLLDRAFAAEDEAVAAGRAALRGVLGMDDIDGRLAAGAYALPHAVLLVRADGAAFAFAGTEAPQRLARVPVAEADDGAALLVWSALPAADASDLAWTGRLDAPLAGTWSIELPHGDRWWEAAPFRRWALPAAVACLAFLLVPTALAIALVRRRRLDAARSRFVNELAHDLRTPLTSLRLHAEMLAEGRVRAQDEERYLGVLSQETARLSSLLANLLDLARLESRARPLARERLVLADAVADAVRDFGAAHPTRAADVSIEVSNGVAAAADRAALARCLANLLDNAGKFTDAGTPIRVSAAHAGEGRVRVVVEDEGAGVAPRERERVFRLYERGEAAARTRAPGTGLGLALVRELAESMGGRAALLPSERGARFAIDLPEARDG